MADFTITASSVLRSAAGAFDDGTAGETITAGQPVYRDASDSGKIKVADANVAAKVQVIGISEHAALTGQPIRFCTADTDFALGTTIAAGVGVWLSATAGLLCLETDLSSGCYGVFIGVGVGSNKIKLRPCVGGARA